MDEAARCMDMYAYACFYRITGIVKGLNIGLNGTLSLTRM